MKGIGKAGGENICLSVKKPHLEKTGMSFPDVAGAPGRPSLADLAQGGMGAREKKAIRKILGKKKRQPLSFAIWKQPWRLFAKTGSVVAE